MPERLPDREAQIRAILASGTWEYALAHLSDRETIDDIRFRDLITVSEDDVYAHVLEHGFDERRVSERRADPIMDDGKFCILPSQDGRWRVFFLERGQRSPERVLPSLAAARKHVVHELLRSARISLNHRFKLAHPELELPPPSEMD
jgi:hypothetical protein